LRYTSTGPLSSQGRLPRLQREQSRGPPRGPYREGWAATPLELSPRTLRSSLNCRPSYGPHSIGRRALARRVPGPQTPLFEPSPSGVPFRNPCFHPPVTASGLRSCLAVKVPAQRSLSLGELRSTSSKGLSENPQRLVSGRAATCLRPRHCPTPAFLLSATPQAGARHVARMGSVLAPAGGGRRRPVWQVSRQVLG